MSKKINTYQLPSHSSRTLNREYLHRTYAGPIYASDFNTEYSSGTMASRIAASERFDQQCRKDCNMRDLRAIQAVHAVQAAQTTQVAQIAQALWTAQMVQTSRDGQAEQPTLRQAPTK